MLTRQLNFLNTRPTPQNERLTALLVQHLPVSVITLPTIEIIGYPVADITTQLQKIGEQPDVWIFTSVNAVQFSQAVIDGSIKKNLAIAIGNATAQALKQQGWQQVCQPSKANSEAILAMPELQKLQCQRVILVTGEDGRELIVQQLGAVGIQVTTLFCYRRQQPRTINEQEIAKIHAMPIDIVLVSSIESFKNLQKILGETVKTLYQTSQWLVFSDRIKHYLASYIAQTRLWVCEPSNQAVIDMTKRIAKDLSA